MAKIKNVSGEDREVPSLGGKLVEAGEIVEVPDDAVYGFTQQESNWAPSDKAAKDAHKDAEKAPGEADEPAADSTDDDGGK